MYFSGHNILRIRNKLNLTQSEFAKRIGYSRTYLSDIEVGKVEPSRRFVESVSKQLGVPLSSLASSGLKDWLNYTLSTTESAFFVFIYGFTDNELAEGEDELLLYLQELDSVVIDAEAISSAKELEVEIMRLGEKMILENNKGDEGLDYLQFCKHSEYFIIFIKNYSRSGIPEKGLVLSNLIKQSLTQHVIVLDKPSFLEHYQRELYHLAKINPAKIDN